MQQEFRGCGGALCELVSLGHEAPGSMGQKITRYGSYLAVEKIPGGLKVCDANGQSLAYVYSRENDERFGALMVEDGDSVREDNDDGPHEGDTHDCLHWNSCSSSGGNQSYGGARRSRFNPWCLSMER